MSVQDLPSDPETTPEPDERVIRRLVRALDFARGFWLGFAKSNTPAQRRRLAALCKDLLEPFHIRVLEIELTEAVTDLLPVLRERLAQESAALAADAQPDDAPAMTGEASTRVRQPKLAIFVYGLEHSIPSREAYPPLLSSLNLKRELFRQQVPHPLLLWLPDYALTALARKAPDFWAWRSGLYEFAPEREAAEQSFNAVRGAEVHVIESLSEQAKRERLVMLKGLLDDYRELGDSSHERKTRVNLLTQIGVLHGMLGEWVETKHALEEALKESRNLEDDSGQAAVLHNLGRMAQEQGELKEARRLYGESLEIKKRLGNQSGVAATLHELAMLAHNQGEMEEARRLYDESLQIAKGLGDQEGVAATLHELGRLAQNQGELKEARRLYGESLEIEKRLGYQSGVAITLGQMGLLAESEGDTAEATRLLREALSIFEKLGSPYAEIARQNLERMEGREDSSD